MRPALRLLVLTWFAPLFGAAPASAQGPGASPPEPPAERRTETMAWRELRLAADRERAIWERLRVNPDDEDERQRADADFRAVLTAYENVIRSAPAMAEAYAAYGLLLGRTGNRADALKAYLRANKLDPNIPMVKNQIGNYLAEEGDYKEALPYYLAAIELDDAEPLYHYQLGQLLNAYRRFFVDDGLFTDDVLDRRIQSAFQRAAALAPANWAYLYRYAESFYDLATPAWDRALAEWRRLEERADTGLGRQTIRLHIANVQLRAGAPEEAAATLATIDEPALQERKRTLVAQLPESPED